MPESIGPSSGNPIEQVRASTALGSAGRRRARQRRRRQRSYHRFGPRARGAVASACRTAPTSTRPRRDAAAGASTTASTASDPQRIADRLLQLEQDLERRAVTRAARRKSLSISSASWRRRHGCSRSSSACCTQETEVLSGDDTAAIQGIGGARHRCVDALTRLDAERADACRMLSFGNGAARSTSCSPGPTRARRCERQWLRNLELATPLQGHQRSQRRDRQRQARTRAPAAGQAARRTAPAVYGRRGTRYGSLATARSRARLIGAAFLFERQLPRPIKGTSRPTPARSAAASAPAPAYPPPGHARARAHRSPTCAPDDQQRDVP